MHVLKEIQRTRADTQGWGYSSSLACITVASASSAMILARVKFVEENLHWWPWHITNSLMHLFINCIWLQIFSCQTNIHDTEHCICQPLFWHHPCADTGASFSPGLALGYWHPLIGTVPIWGAKCWNWAQTSGDVAPGSSTGCPVLELDGQCWNYAMAWKPQIGPCPILALVRMWGYPFWH